jgi:hypothetical protein
VHTPLTPVIGGGGRVGVSANGPRHVSVAIVRYCYAIAAVVELSGYSFVMALTPAGIATERSTPRKNNKPSPASATLPQNYASNSAVGQTFANHCHPSLNGRAAEPTSAFAMRSRRSKPKPSKHASAKRLIFAPLPITSDDGDPEDGPTAVSRPQSGQSTASDKHHLR